MLGFGQEELIGNDLSSTLPLQLVQTITQLAGNSCGEYIVELPTGRCRAYITRISGADQDAIVIALLKES